MIASLLALAFIAALAAAAMARHRRAVAGLAAILTIAAVGVGIVAGMPAAPLALASIAAGVALAAAGLPEERLPPVALAVLLLAAALIAALQVAPVERVTGPETAVLLQGSFLLLGGAAMIVAVATDLPSRLFGGVLGLALAATALLSGSDGLTLTRPLVSTDGTPLLLLTWREAASPPLMQALLPHPDALAAWIFLAGVALLLLLPAVPQGLRARALALPAMAAMLLVALPLFSGPVALAPEIAEQLVRPGPGAVNAVLYPAGSAAVPALAPLFAMAAGLGLATVLAVRVPLPDAQLHEARSHGPPRHDEAWLVHLALVLVLLATGLRLVARLRDGAGPLSDPVAVLLLAVLVVVGTGAIAGPLGRRASAAGILAALTFLVSVSGSWW